MAFIKGDTIVALATAPLAAGVAVIRISGPKAKGVVDKLCPSFAGVDPRYMHYGKLKSATAALLDETLMVYFKAPHSFTGEDIVEINCHGGVAVVDGLIGELLKEEAVRHADAGEFTRRAFMNDKMDLTAAEGVADLVAAETEEQKKQALSQMKGELGEGFERWRQRIIHLLAHSEAAIDFPDEELDVLADAGVKGKLDEVIADLENAIKTDVGCRLRDGFKAVIIGKPNAGKSSLTNLLTGKATAIVSEIEGTTRDIIDTRLNVGGFPIILSDTAGIRETEDFIEKEGVSRAMQKVGEADLVILVTDGTKWPEIDSELVGLLKEKRSLVVFSKKDLFNHSVNS
ncbi:MAG: tRNA modification GTPase, partial [bacterium]